MEKEGKQKNIHAGHRQRQKRRYLEHGLGNFSDIEAIELLLYYAIPQKDTNELAHRVLEAFGSFRGVLEAEHRELVAVEGMGDSAALLVTLVRELNRRYLSHERSRGIQINGAEEAWNYLKGDFRYIKTEKAVMLSLDGMNCVLKKHEVAIGGADHVELPIRIIVETAIQDGATAIILSHNHLDGNAVPSKADILSTQLLYRTLRPINIRLLDHIVIADEDFISILESGGVKM